MVSTKERQKKDDISDDKIWEWMMKELYSIANTLTLKGKKLSTQEKDDLVQEVIFHIFEINRKKEGYTRMLYEGKKRPLLKKILTQYIDIADGKSFFVTNTDFFRYKKIHAVCEEKDIPEKVENAYKIAAFIVGDKITIALIEQILRKKQPKVYNYGLEADLVQDTDGEESEEENYYGTEFA